MLFLEMHSFTSCRLKGRRRKSVNVVCLQDENEIGIVMNED